MRLGEVRFAAAVLYRPMSSVYLLSEFDAEIHYFTRHCLSLLA